MKYGDPPVVRSLLPKQDEVGTSSLREGPADLTPMVLRIREGLPFGEFHALRALLAIPEEELGRLLGISPATLNRRKKSRHLGTPESERVVRFARLFGIAMDVLGTEEAARGWLKTANPGTAGECPLSYADTEFGAREVENLLGRLDHGVF
ncbi:toxin-antitoxin system antitoxin [Haloferula helveola]|uniref:Toxin-antitoxin system antitoxin n=1 Tax=Haloferula helveola TaxID=490095 RepID=A0ABN6H249_9BACT|nr:toxin-antitoxin system antitoxin [Haloferula helveola]